MAASIYIKKYFPNLIIYNNNFSYYSNLGDAVDALADISQHKLDELDELAINLEFKEDAAESEKKRKSTASASGSKHRKIDTPPAEIIVISDDDSDKNSESEPCSQDVIDALDSDSSEETSESDCDF